MSRPEVKGIEQYIDYELINGKLFSAKKYRVAGDYCCSYSKMGGSCNCIYKINTRNLMASYKEVNVTEIEKMCPRLGVPSYSKLNIKQEIEIETKRIEEPVENDLYIIDNVQKYVDKEKVFEKVFNSTEKKKEVKNVFNMKDETIHSLIGQYMDNYPEKTNNTATDIKSSAPHKEYLLLEPSKRFGSPMEKYFECYVKQDDHGYTLKQLQNNFVEVTKIIAKTCFRYKLPKLALEYLYYNWRAVYGESHNATKSLYLTLKNTSPQHLLLLTETHVDSICSSIMIHY